MEVTGYSREKKKIFGGEIKKLRGHNIQRIFSMKILKSQFCPSGIVTGIPLRELEQAKAKNFPRMRKHNAS